MKTWVAPKATDWIDMTRVLGRSWAKLSGKPCDRLSAIQLAVDRADGRLYCYPGAGPLLVSRDGGQRYEVFSKKELGHWGFTESPTSLYVSADDGKKIRLCASARSGITLDGGRTWKYMNFKINFGFEDGLVNWNRDAKLIVARSHTWPHPRMWISRDGGNSFTEYSKEVTARINSLTMALLDDDVMLFQTGVYWTGSMHLVRTTDYGKTFREVPFPAYKDKRLKNRGFIGISRRFNGKVYWLNNMGVYTSADKGLTWRLVGNYFPDNVVRKKMVRTGPFFGRDGKQMVVMCADRFIETLDGGETWHVLAQAPITFGILPWQYSGAYDPVHDVLYCSHRHHGSGPNPFARLALKRWGNIETTPPIDPAAVKAEPLQEGRLVRIAWKPSEDKSGIAWYRVFVNGKLTYYALRNSIVLYDLDWGEKAKIGIQAEDYWQNRSRIVEVTVQAGKAPTGIVYLKDLPHEPCKLEIVDRDTTGKKKTSKPLRIMGGMLRPLAETHYAPCRAVRAFAVHVTRKQGNKQGNKQGKTAVLTYKLGRKYKRLFVDVGLPAGDWGPLSLAIRVNGKTVGTIKPRSYQERNRKAGRPAETFDLDLRGTDTLSFVFTLGNTRYWRESLVVFNKGVLTRK